LLKKLFAVVFRAYIHFFNPKKRDFGGCFFERKKEKGQTYTFDKILKNKKRFGVASQKLNIWE
jgi:hypothetical protein